MEIKNFITNNGINVKLIQTKKFKTISCLVAFRGEYNQKIVSSRSLLISLLVNSCKKYNTKKQLLEYASSLYMADVSADILTLQIYKNMLTTFQIDIVDSKIVKNRSLFSKSMKLLKELIYNPNLSHKGFKKCIFDEEKRALEQDIKNIYSNKKRYAMRQLLKNMGNDEVFSISKDGALEDLKNVNRFNILDDYYKMIKEEEMYIEIIGDLTENEVSNALKVFDINNCKLPLVETPITKEINEVKLVEETQDINQTQVFMGYRTNINTLKDDYLSLLVFNAMFGGIFISDLFTEIREKHSLAYDISSFLIANTSLLIINAGISYENFDLMKKLIDEILERYKNNEIKDDLLNIAKKTLIDDYNANDDSPSSIITFALTNNFFKNYTINDIIEKIKNVTKDDIKKVVNKLELDTIYILKPGDKHENN